jgi:hypothetical protein
MQRSGTHKVHAPDCHAGGRISDYAPTVGVPSQMRDVGRHSKGGLRMKRTDQLLAASLALTCAVSGCSDRDKADSSSSSIASAAATDAWLGQWNGPEGTFLRLEGGKGKYVVTVQNLDGPQTYQGSTNGAQLQFERNGVKETIRATTGAETGMKWLSSKANCLTIRLGEGYCRD